MEEYFKQKLCFYGKEKFECTQQSGFKIGDLVRFRYVIGKEGEKMFVISKLFKNKDGMEGAEIETKLNKGKLILTVLLENIISF